MKIRTRWHGIHFWPKFSLRNTISYTYTVASYRMNLYENEISKMFFKSILFRPIALSQY